MLKTLKTLPSDQWCILKMIAVTGPEWNRFTGYVFYKRPINAMTWDRASQQILNDILDNAIFQVINEKYPNSRLSSQMILLEDQLADILARYAGGTTKEITLLCYPDIGEIDPAIAVGMTLNTFSLTAQMRLLLGPTSERIQHIESFYSFDLPFNRVAELSHTIETM